LELRLTRQEEILFLLRTYGIRQSWLAKKLGLKKQTLTYLLKESPHLDDDIYKKIKEIIDNYQLELDLFRDDEEELDLFTEENLRLGVGERIRIFAKRKYNTLKALADAMEMKPQQLQQYVSGRREPGTKILRKLLRLGCDINWLLGGAESLESYRVFKLEQELKRNEIALEQIRNALKKLEG
jgi:transcriptional regulator with XRE-family HTH domain